VCLMEIPANECLATLPTGSGSDNYCTGPAGTGSAIQVHMGELCAERGDQCGTHGSLNNCPVMNGVAGSHYHGIYRRVDCVKPASPPAAPPPSTPPVAPPPVHPQHAKLKVHTCNVNYADSDQAIFYQADGGSLVEIDNPGDDREKNQDDEYTVDWAHNTFSIVTQSTDGWCIDSITYGSLSVDLSNQQKSGVWLDKPCEKWAYDRPCTNKITIDITTGAVTQHHDQGGYLPLDLPYLKVHTCNVKHGGTDDAIQYSPSPAFSSSNSQTLDTYDHDDREKNKFDTYYNLKPASGTFNLAAMKSDGWCIDSIEYVWASQNINMKADLSCTQDKSVWLDSPCTETSYSGVPCAQNIMVSVLDGDVKMMGVKGQPADWPNDLGSCKTKVGMSTATAVYLKSPHNNDKCADYHTGNGEMYMGGCHDGNNQKFYFDAYPVGRIRTNHQSGKCLDWHMGNNNLYWGNCHDGNNQKFYFEGHSWPTSSGGAQRMKSLYGGECVDWHTGNDNLYMGGCHGGNNQKFYLQ